MDRSATRGQADRQPGGSPRGSALAISGGGALSSFETTPLMTVEETNDALSKAEQIQYKAPGT